MIKILWVDDEIEHFKSHILFLNKKGYDIDKPRNLAKSVTVE